MNIVEKLKIDVLVFIKKNPKVTRSEISQGLRINMAAVEKATATLYDENRLIFEQINKTFTIHPDYDWVDLVSEEDIGEKPLKPILQRRKPYTPNKMQGFKSQNGKVTVFLERRCQAKSVTFNKEQLLNMLSSCN